MSTLGQPGTSVQVVPLIQNHISSVFFWWVWIKTSNQRVYPSASKFPSTCPQIEAFCFWWSVGGLLRKPVGQLTWMKFYHAFQLACVLLARNTGFKSELQVNFLVSGCSGFPEQFRKHQFCFSIPKVYNASKTVSDECKSWWDDGYAELGTRFKASHVKLMIWWLAKETQEFADQHQTESWVFWSHLGVQGVMSCNKLSICCSSFLSSPVTLP